MISSQKHLYFEDFTYIYRERELLGITWRHLWSHFLWLKNKQAKQPEALSRVLTLQGPQGGGGNSIGMERDEISAIGFASLLEVDSPKVFDPNI